MRRTLERPPACSRILHVCGHAGLVGAVVVIEPENRVIATSTSLRFMQCWTKLQVYAYIASHNCRVRSEPLLNGSELKRKHGSADPTNPRTSRALG